MSTRTRKNRAAILLVTDNGTPPAGLTGRALRSIAGARREEAVDALTTPGRRWHGVVWHVTGRAARTGLAQAMRSRGDLPFVALMGRHAARRPKGFRACVRLPNDAALLVDIVDREARLMEAESKLAAARSRARAYVKKLSVLADIAQAANSVLEPRRVMEIVMSRAQDLIPTRAWTLLLIDDKEHILNLELASGENLRPVKNYRLKIGQGIAGWVVQYRRPILVNDVREDRRFDARFDMITGFRTKSMIAAPLISRGRIIGAVEMMNRRSRPFDEDDVAMLTTLVEPGAIALENAILYQRTAELTVTDDLTKLYNSRYLNTHLKREIKRSRRYGVPVSLIFLDLDGFKSINDVHGHLAGSRALFEVGQIIQATVREIDVVARYGGDEFTVILPQTGLEGAMIIAERVRASIEANRFLVDLGSDIRLTASFGVSTFPLHGETREELIQEADRAMYRVKDRGKNGVLQAAPERSQTQKGGI